jgi:hypothetical protein
MPFSCQHSEATQAGAAAGAGARAAAAAAADHELCSTTCTFTLLQAYQCVQMTHHRTDDDGSLVCFAPSMPEHPASAQGLESADCRHYPSTAVCPYCALHAYQYTLQTGIMMSRQAAARLPMRAEEARDRVCYLWWVAAFLPFNVRPVRLYNMLHRQEHKSSTRRPCQGAGLRTA